MQRNGRSVGRDDNPPCAVTHLVPALFGAGGIVGGAERYALEFARHMARSVPTRLVTFGPRNQWLREGELSIRVLGNPWYVRNQPSNPFSLGLVRALGKTDLLHCHQQHVAATSTPAAFCGLTPRRTF